MIWLMLIVSDTSPISNLAIIGRLDFLKRLHEVALIPSAVWTELSRLRQTEGRNAIQMARDEGWLKVEQVTKILPPIENLDPGETEAIALAIAQGTTLLIDESKGRQAARDRGVQVVGAVGILIAARKKGWIAALKPELIALREEARFFLSAQFYAAALASIGEQP